MNKNSSIILSALSNEMQVKLREHFIKEHLQSFVASIKDNKSDVSIHNKNIKNAKVVKNSEKANGSMSAFILSQPLNIPADDVIEAGRFAGLDISKGLIYNVRTKMRKQISNQS